MQMCGAGAAVAVSMGNSYHHLLGNTEGALNLYPADEDNECDRKSSVPAPLSGPLPKDEEQTSVGGEWNLRNQRAQAQGLLHVWSCPENLTHDIVNPEETDHPTITLYPLLFFL